jgi:hypothetical protein
MEPKIYLYKMTTDNGGAPCVWKGLLSLAICKGVIRRKAEKGSVIFGFGGKNYRERLLYIAEVTDKPDTGKYYRDAMYQNRPDCIYKEMSDGTACLKEHAQYHTKSNELVRDVGMNFEKANVLLSTDFRYFGKAGTDKYKDDYEAIKATVESMGRAFRVNHSTEFYMELQNLKTAMWKTPKKKQGEPSSSDTDCLCSGGDIEEVCK